MNYAIKILGLAFLLGAQSAAFAQSNGDLVDSNAIEKALEVKKEPLTRGFGTTRSLGTRGVRVKVKSKVDLNIPFEINSAALKPSAEAQLGHLEAALKKDSLLSYHFEVIGHTDASGSGAYNRGLSERRAKSVKSFLVQRGIDPTRLKTVGLGEDQLLLPDSPNHPDNRRVEIKNLGERQ